MKCIDLHGTERYYIFDTVEKFITDNFDHLPILIITGHSDYNIDTVRQIVDRYDLSMHKERLINGGAWVVT